VYQPWGEEEGIQNSGGKPGGNIPVGRHGPRWENNINMYLKETGWDGMVWTRLICFRMGTSIGLL
jgi:hypothetical protein